MNDLVIHHAFPEKTIAYNWLLSEYKHFLQNVKLDRQFVELFRIAHVHAHDKAVSEESLPTCEPNMMAMKIIPKIKNSMWKVFV